MQYNTRTRFSDREPISTAPILDLPWQDLKTIRRVLPAYHEIYSSRFSRWEQQRWSLVYLNGLLTHMGRKTIAAMESSLRSELIVDLRGSRDAVRAMQQFLSEGAWDDTAILHRLWQELAIDLGDADGVLILDGSEFSKQGQESVGTERQYCSEQGKIVNCQAGVFLAYASQRGYALLDRRLYLPETWFADDYTGRRRACRVPDNLTFMTKSQLGWAMIEAVVRSGTLLCRWVSCDEDLGKNLDLLDRIATLGLWYLAEVPHDTRVWPERVAPALPPWSGCAPKRVVAEAPAPQEVQAVAAALPPEQWQRYVVQAGRQGPQVAEFAFLHVSAIRDELPGPEVWLVLRRNLRRRELKTYLCNAPADIPHERLVRSSGMHWPIEICLEVGRQRLGMGDYTVRGWRGWHHHMTLVILALGFLVWLDARLKGRADPGHITRPSLLGRLDLLLRRRNAD